jgi:hypothetical protein
VAGRTTPLACRIGNGHRVYENPEPAQLRWPDGLGSRWRRQPAAGWRTGGHKRSGVFELLVVIAIIAI